MPALIALRTFERGDLDQVLRIEKESFPDPYDKLVFLWFELAAGKGFIVATMGDEVVGYIIAQVRGGRGHVASMAVSPGHRREGIGEALLEESVARLAGRVGQVCLEVRPTNEAAIGLYRKLSFTETGEVKRRYYPDGEDGVVMARRV